MNCFEIQDLAAALIDHEPLSASEYSEVEHHLANCSTCKHEYEMDRMTSSIVRARLPLVDAPEDTYRSILEAIEEV